MDDEQPRRVTLEDYSSTSVPQFSLSKVQAQNITYPHSLIQLIQGNQFHGLPNEALRCFCRGKIKLKTPEEAMELIENMAASDHTILRDRTHYPTKKSLLEMSSQDALLA
ncbi:hypothetical protein GmHk_04G010093 [Glycine max]|nr:hypothetical protein GmHk_04G010093 [Glycine max]